MNWKTISLILSIFGCLRNFRPSDPFLTPYLMGPWKNFTSSQVEHEIYPPNIYSSFLSLILVFLITDFARYKPVILVSCICATASSVITLVGKSILLLQIAQIFYGLYISTEVSYFTYIYNKVDKEHYQEVTSHAKAACLLGRFMSGITAQLMTSFEILDFEQLQYLTLAASALSIIGALFLPAAEKSIYFHQRETVADNAGSGMVIPAIKGENRDAEDPKICAEPQRESGAPSKNGRFRRAFRMLWNNFLSAYTNRRVIKWTCWWASSTCGYLQVVTYSQILWETAVARNKAPYNGAADFMYAITSALAVFCIGKVPLNWPLLENGAISISSFMEGAVLVLSSYSHNIWFLYGYYVAFGVFHQTTLTIASSELAKNISEESYGLVFGINAFLTLLVDSIFTAILQYADLIPNVGFQFLVIGGYFVVFGIAFALMTIVTIVRHCKGSVKCKDFANQIVLKKVGTRD